MGHDKELSTKKAFHPLFNLPSFFDEVDRRGCSVYEDDSHVFVEADLPGLDVDNIDVRFENDVLSIRGEKKEEKKDEKRRYYHRSSSAFSYQVNVPGNIDHSQAPDATYKDGVMKVAFHKRKGGHDGSSKIQVKRG